MPPISIRFRHVHFVTIVKQTMYCHVVLTANEHFNEFSETMLLISSLFVYVYRSVSYSQAKRRTYLRASEMMWNAEWRLRCVSDRQVCFLSAAAESTGTLYLLSLSIVDLSADTRLTTLHTPRKPLLYEFNCSINSSVSCVWSIGYIVFRYRKSVCESSCWMQMECTVNTSYVIGDRCLIHSDFTVYWLHV